MALGKVRVHSSYDASHVDQILVISPRVAWLPGFDDCKTPAGLAVDRIALLKRFQAAQVLV